MPAVGVALQHGGDERDRLRGQAQNEHGAEAAPGQGRQAGDPAHGRYRTLERRPTPGVGQDVARVDVEQPPGELPQARQRRKMLVPEVPHLVQLVGRLDADAQEVEGEEAAEQRDRERQPRRQAPPAPLPPDDPRHRQAQSAAEHDSPVGQAQRHRDGRRQDP